MKLKNKIILMSLLSAISWIIGFITNNSILIYIGLTGLIVTITLYEK